MAGMFGLFDYSKPGPGVSKNEPQKHGFIVFFEIFFRKFWLLIQVNLLYLLCCIPIVTIGPATAGFTCIMRNYAREEHAFPWLDFKDTFKKNWKQAFIASVVNAVIFLFLYIAITYYSRQLKNFIMVLPLAVCIAAAALFVFMQFYIYTLIITFKLKLRQVYKNAFIFAGIGLPRNLLVTFVLAVFWGALVLFAPISLIIFLPTIALSFSGMLINFCVWPVIKKFMVDPYYTEHPDEVAEEKEALFQDDVTAADNARNSDDNEAGGRSV